MNYKKIYTNIIENRKITPFDGYVEKHHIIPRCLGGSDDESNLVSLSAREHFICHLLLTKCYEPNTIEYKKMIKAFMMMLICKREDQERYVSSREFERIREQYSNIMKEIMKDNQKGDKNSQYGTVWVHNDETREIKKIKKTDVLPEGWVLGRSLDSCKKEAEKTEKVNRKKEEKQLVYAYLNDWYDLYTNVGFEEFVKKTGYDKSKPNLVQMFKKYVKGFSPQNGKKRGNGSIPL